MSHTDAFLFDTEIFVSERRILGIRFFIVFFLLWRVWMSKNFLLHSIFLTVFLVFAHITALAFWVTQAFDELTQAIWRKLAVGKLCRNWSACSPRELLRQYLCAYPMVWIIFLVLGVSAPQSLTQVHTSLKARHFWGSSCKLSRFLIQLVILLSKPLFWRENKLLRPEAQSLGCLVVAVRNKPF